LIQQITPRKKEDLRVEERTLIKLSKEMIFNCQTTAG